MRLSFVTIIALVLLSAINLFGTASATTCPLGQTLANGACTSTTSVFYSWIPVIVLAILAAAALTVAYYGIASLIGNPRLKAQALDEFAQVLGTAVVIVLILGLLNIYGGLSFSAYPKLNSAVQAICGPNQLGSPTTQITFLSSNSNTPGPTQMICSDIVDQASTGGITQNIDYGLGSTYALVANITNQAGNSLNYLNVFESYYATLANMKPQESICWPGLCASSLKAAVGTITYVYQPFYIYGKVRGGTLFIGVEASLSFYVGLLEMLLIILMIFGWPYLLAAGLILRASAYTRKAGGLLIAIVLVGMLLFPILNIFEYLSLSNVTNPLSTANSPIGLTQTSLTQATVSNTVLYGIPTGGSLSTPQDQSACSTLGGTLDANGDCCYTPPGGVYVCAPLQETGSQTSSSTSNSPTTSTTPIVYDTSHINFYVFPRLDYILNYDGCWPTGGDIFLQDALIAGSYSVPGYGLILAIKDLIGSFTSTIPLPTAPGFSCNPPNLIKSVLDLASFYGQIFPFTLLMPVLNILMLLSAVKGISSLLGGDTNLLGLGRIL